MKIGVYYRINKSVLFYREFNSIYDYGKWFIEETSKDNKLRIVEVISW